MIVFNVKNDMTHVENPHEIAEAIGKYFTIKRDGFVKSIDWDIYNSTGNTVLKTKYHPETIKLYNMINQTFPSGRLGYVLDWMEERGLPYEVNDLRQKPEKHLDITYTGPVSDGSNGKPVREYQLQAASIIEEHGGRGVLWHATASGKTCTAARVISAFGVNTLYMVPSLELLHQTHKELGKMLKIYGGIGMVGEGVWDPKAVTVATTATLWSRFERPECKKLLADTEMLIIDEIHHVSIKTARNTKNSRGVVQQVNSWYILAMNCNAYYRIGLTGTPGKDIEQKRALLECAIGRVISRISSRELIDLGIISDVEIHMHKIKHNRAYSDYPTARKEGVLLNERFNEYVVSVAIAEAKAGHNILLLTGSKMHQGPLLQKIFERYGYTVPFVSGDSNNKSRQKARDDFRDGKLKILIGTIYKEGVDFPLCDCGFNCDAGYDEKKTIQFLGRILRKATGKRIARLHDFNHRDNKFLKRHSNNRIITYMEEELEKIITHNGIEV
jgi:superfamily II DNA or RNA helicase